MSIKVQKQASKNRSPTHNRQSQATIYLGCTGRWRGWGYSCWTGTSRRKNVHNAGYSLCFHVECFIPHQLRQETIPHTQPAGLLTGRRQRGTWTWATEIRKGTAPSVRSQQNDNDLNVAAAAGQGEPTAGVHDANPTCWPHSHLMWFWPETASPSFMATFMSFCWNTYEACRTHL